MGYPRIPDINPDINIDREEVINLLLASIGLEEISLAHLVNAEAEKLQRALGTLQRPGTTGDLPEDYFPDLIDDSLEDLLRVNRRINKTLKLAMHKEFILLTKLEDIIDFVREAEPEIQCPCSITGTNRGQDGGAVPVTIEINNGTPVIGTANFTLNICNDCGGSNNFNFVITAGGQNYNFTQGRVSDVSEIICDGDEDTATFEGVIRLAGGGGTFDITVNVTDTSIEFVAINQDPAEDIQRFEATLIIQPNQVEIEECPITE